jgi:nickel superoxide dismutase
MKTLITTSIIAAVAILSFSPQAGAHCQIPCGIYDDNNVIEAMHTDWMTIEKATKQIPLLMEDPTKNANQIGRWITNKEQHCQNIQDTVARYFLAQRVKVPAADGDKAAYLKKLALCHQVIVAAMKCKQAVDPKAVEALHGLMHDFEDTFGEKE